MQGYNLGWWSIACFCQDLYLSYTKTTQEIFLYNICTSSHLKQLEILLWLLWIWIEPVDTFHIHTVLNIKKLFVLSSVLIIGGKRKWSIRKETSIYVSLAWSGAAISSVETSLCYFQVWVNHWESDIYQGRNFQLAWPQMWSVKKDMKTKKSPTANPAKKQICFFQEKQVRYITTRGFV